MVQQRPADISEALPGGPLDVPQDGQFVQAHASDMHKRILHGTPDSLVCR
jgi:hypothetical protein